MAQDINELLLFTLTNSSCDRYKDMGYYAGIHNNSILFCEDVIENIEIPLNTHYSYFLEFVNNIIVENVKTNKYDWRIPTSSEMLFIKKTKLIINYPYAQLDITTRNIEYLLYGRNYSITPVIKFKLP